MTSLALTPIESPARRLWRLVLRLKLALIDRRKYDSVALEHVCGIPVVVLPDVFNPKLLRSGAFLSEQLHRADLVPPGTRVLDLGCGSGACGLVAAQYASDLVAVDISPSAVRCTRINAMLNNISIDVRQGDLFGPVENDRFDVVLFNPPYYRGVPGNMLDHAWRSPDLAERFAAELGDHLRSGGHALLVLSSDGDSAAFLGALRHAGFTDSVVARRDFINEVMTVHSVRPC